MRISIFILALCLTFSACKKEDHSLPAVRFISAKMSKDSNFVDLLGVVESAGGGNIQFRGFCFSNHPKTTMYENRQVVNGDLGKMEFSFRPMFDSTYYIRCFAQNEYGHVISKEVEFRVPHPSPKTAPCELKENVVHDQGNSYPTHNIYVDNALDLYDVYSVHVSNYYNQFMPSIDIDFKKVPVNGIYVTISASSDLSFSEDPNAISVRMFDKYAVEAGDSLYVTENPDSTLTLSFCRFKYNVNNYPITTKAKFTFKK